MGDTVVSVLWLQAPELRIAQTCFDSLTTTSSTFSTFSCRVYKVILPAVGQTESPKHQWAGVGTCKTIMHISYYDYKFPWETMGLILIVLFYYWTSTLTVSEKFYYYLLPFLPFFKPFILYWVIANEQCSEFQVNHEKGLAIHVHVSILSQTPSSLFLLTL